MKANAEETKRILLVDDEAQVRFILSSALKRVSHLYEIATAISGRDALAKMKETHFDLLVTDIRLPGIDGIQLTEAVRVQGDDPVVIWITAYGSPGLHTEAKRLGVWRCIDKPIDIREFRECIRLGLEQGGSSSL